MAMDETFPDLGALNDKELKELIDQLSQGGARGVLPPAPAARQDRHPPRRARQPPARQACARPGHLQRRGRRAADRDPRGARGSAAAGHRSGIAAGPLWLCTAPSVASSTPKARTTARNAARCSSSTTTASRRRRPTASARPGTSSRSTSARSPRMPRRSSSAPAAGAPARASPSTGERMTIGRRPDSAVFLDDITVSRDHALLVHRGQRLVHRRLRLAQRHLRQPRADRLAAARGRRRAAGRQVQADLPGTTMSTVPADRGPGAQAPGVEGLDDRRRLQGAFDRVPRHLDLQDPLSRGSAAADAAAHPRRLPPVQPRATSRACARSCGCSATSSCRCV